jgi:hypothetical protein
VFLFFSVARSAHTSQAERANGAHDASGHTEALSDNGERMPTDKLLDISPQALRMSSPFNAGYWTAA